MLCGRWTFAWMQWMQNMMALSFGRYKPQCSRSRYQLCPTGGYHTEWISAILQSRSFVQRSATILEWLEWTTAAIHWLRCGAERSPNNCTSGNAAISAPGFAKAHQANWPKLRTGPGKWFIGLGWRSTLRRWSKIVRAAVNTYLRRQKNLNWMTNTRHFLFNAPVLTCFQFKDGPSFCSGCMWIVLAVPLHHVMFSAAMVFRSWCTIETLKNRWRTAVFKPSSAQFCKRFIDGE